MDNRTILWDFDGTLAYREGMWTGTLIEVLQAEEPHLSVDRDVLRSHLQSGFPWHTPERPHCEVRDASEWWRVLAPVFERAFAALDVGSERSSKLAGHVRAAFLRPERWRLFADTVPALKLLSDHGWTHSILSNHVPELAAIVSSLGISSHFLSIHTSALIGYEKPHPEAFRTVLETIEAGSDIWMIGDSVDADVRGAEQAGIPAILVRKTSDSVRYQCAGVIQAARLIRDANS